MKRILIAQYSLGGGGAEKVLIDILNNIDYKKYKVDLFLLRKEGVYLDRLNENVRVFSVLDKFNFKEEKLNKLLNDIRFLLVKFFSRFVHKITVGNNYDIEIAFVEGLTSKFIADSSNKTSEKLAWVHIDLEKYRPIKEFFQKRFYPKFNKIVCVSEESRRVFGKLYPSLKNKTVVLYNIIDSKEIVKFSSENINYRNESPVVIGVGRLSPQKRFDILIKAHKLLLDEGVKNKLLILGEGDKRKELEALIDKLGVKDTVDLYGFVRNPYPYIKNAQVFAMSSDFEGLPLVVCESLVLGKPIISTRCTGPTELLDDGKYGILVDCNDEVQLKDGLKELLTNKDVYNNYCEKSLERSKIFDTKEAMKNLYDLF